MSTELAMSFRDRINQLHAENLKHGQDMRFGLLSWLNTTRECGLLLEEAKSTLSQTQWKDLQSNLDFGDKREQSIQTYLDFARKNPDPIINLQHGYRSLQDSMMVTELLAFPDSHGPQHLHTPNVFSWTNKTMTHLLAEMNKRISREPINTWSAEGAEQFIHQVQPKVDAMQAIIDKAKERV